MPFNIFLRTASPDSENRVTVTTGNVQNSCVAKAKSELLKLGDITSAEVQLQPPQATLSMQKHIPVMALQTALQKAGNTISEAFVEWRHAPFDKGFGRRKQFVVNYL